MEKIWKLNLTPKVILFTWKLLHNFLPLGHELKRRGYKVEGKCAFGCNAIEDRDHLFISCPFSRRIWQGSSVGIKPDLIPHNSFDEWIKFLLSLNQQPNLPDNLFEQILIICWKIYCSRKKNVWQSRPGCWMHRLGNQEPLRPNPQQKPHLHSLPSYFPS